MKSPLLRFPFLLTLLFTLASLPTHAQTLMLQLRASPVEGVGLVPQVLLRPLSDIVESTVLEYCFDLGLVVSTFPPVLSETTLDLASKPSDTRQAVWNTQDLKAQYLLVIALATGPVPLSGDPEIMTARMEFHRIVDGTASTLDIDRSPPLALELGKLIVSRLKAFL